MLEQGGNGRELVNESPITIFVHDEGWMIQIQDGEMICFPITKESLGSHAYCGDCLQCVIQDAFPEARVQQADIVLPNSISLNDVKNKLKEALTKKGAHYSMF